MTTIFELLKSIRARHSMAHEVDAVELVAEALAGGERGLEIGLAQYIGVDLALGDDGGVARLAADQRNLAKKVARPHARNLAVGADHLDLTVRDQEELLSELTLANDRLAGGEMALRHVFRDIRELPRRQCL